MTKQNKPEQVGTSMSLPKQAEWEKDLRSVIDAHYENYGSKESLVTSMKAVISDILSKQEAEHKKKIGCRHNKTRYECPCFHEGFITGDAEQGFNKIQQLKQQHLEELESLKMKRYPFDTTNSDGYNTAVDEINTKIDQLINSQKGK